MAGRCVIITWTGPQWSRHLTPWTGRNSGNAEPDAILGNIALRGNAETYILRRFQASTQPLFLSRTLTPDVFAYLDW